MVPRIAYWFYLRRFHYILYYVVIDSPKTLLLKGKLDIKFLIPGHESRLRVTQLRTRIKAFSVLKCTMSYVAR
jgi:hypothetical protein